MSVRVRWLVCAFACACEYACACVCVCVPPIIIVQLTNLIASLNKTVLPFVPICVWLFQRWPHTVQF